MEGEMKIKKWCLFRDLKNNIKKGWDILQSKSLLCVKEIEKRITNTV